MKRALRRICLLPCLAATAVVLAAGPALGFTFTVHRRTAVPGEAAAGYRQTVFGEGFCPLACINPRHPARVFSRRNCDGGWLFVPDRLRDGATAPVIVYLHAFGLSIPDFYRTHIEHLLNRGLIVAFPKFHASLFDKDEDKGHMLDRAAEAVDTALALAGDGADTDSLIIFGHSVGALLGLVWESQAGVPAVRAKVLACMSLNIYSPWNSFPDPPKDNELINSLDDLRDRTAESRCPVVLVCGADDTLGKPAESMAAFEVLQQAPSRVVYRYDTAEDDHMVPATDVGPLIQNIINNMGYGNIELSAYDTELVWPLLDGAVAGDYRGADTNDTAVSVGIIDETASGGIRYEYP